MVSKSKKVAQNSLKCKLKLVKMLCENCGMLIEVPEGSICEHCGMKMVKDAKWRHKK